MSARRDKALFTPGPLTTSLSVKEAMLRDLGSRDRSFIEVVRRIRTALLDVAGTSQESGFEAIPIQGSGTYGIESVVGSVVPPGKKLLVVINGSYGERIATIAERLGIEVVSLRFAENVTPQIGELEAFLAEQPDVAVVAAVHCETTTGIMNPIEAMGKVVREHGRTYFVDSMSAFGAVPMDIGGLGVDYLVSSANKCIEGVPGFSFAICRRDALTATEGYARSVSLDLLAQWQGLEASGQFRFTPPTHALLAFDQALTELSAEGGPEGRGRRYAANHAALVDGMRRLGFEEYLAPDVQGPIITSFLYPAHEAFAFDVFYDLLNDRDCVIYPGKVSRADCFRIGTIGRLDTDDVQRLLTAIEEALEIMGVQM